MRYLVAMCMVLCAVGCAGVADVRDNLNDQRELFNLPPVEGDSCEEVVLGFSDYVDMVIPPTQDPGWDIIAATECRNFQSHVDAFNAVCDEWYMPPAELMAECTRLGAWTE